MVVAQGYGLKKCTGFVSQFISCVFAHLEWFGRFAACVSALSRRYLQRTRQQLRLLLLRLPASLLLLPGLPRAALAGGLGERGEVGGRRVADAGGAVLRVSGGRGGYGEEAADGVEDGREGGGGDGRGGEVGGHGHGLVGGERGRGGLWVLWL